MELMNVLLTVLTVKLGGDDKSVRRELHVDGTNNFKDEAGSVFEASAILGIELEFPGRECVWEFVRPYLVCSTVRQTREELVVDITMRSMKLQYYSSEAHHEEKRRLLDFNSR